LVEPVTPSDIDQCLRKSLGGGKMVQPKRFNVVLSNAAAEFVHPAKLAQCIIKALLCCNTILQKRLGVIVSVFQQRAKRVLTVSATSGSALAR
jgi:hypothetical protein